MRFKQRHGFDQCIGCIDGTHIPIRKPPHNEKVYISTYSKQDGGVVCTECGGTGVISTITKQFEQIYASTKGHITHK